MSSEVDLSVISSGSNFRSSLYSVLAHGSLHMLITAHILRPEEEEEEEGRAKPVGIKVGTSPGEIRGCFISKMEDQMYDVGLQPGDR